MNLYKPETRFLSVINPVMVIHTQLSIFSISFLISFNDTFDTRFVSCSFSMLKKGNRYLSPPVLFLLSSSYSVPLLYCCAPKDIPRPSKKKNRLMCSRKIQAIKDRLKQTFVKAYIWVKSFLRITISFFSILFANQVEKCFLAALHQS